MYVLLHLIILGVDPHVFKIYYLFYLIMASILVYL